MVFGDSMLFRQHENYLLLLLFFVIIYLFLFFLLFLFIHCWQSIEPKDKQRLLCQ